ncbi:hypothetical protein LOTGIDRAFT_165224 [Lottia gigantea]|uniref:UspA domain-containing protein n=1 Tax=Lottia gigantea TaxID=225164 RepID=V4BJ62_LOTGI|nr:hypothetical protein LOTGIDRAFT_165224 [Lottia gigantea]ESO88809.1 hypothetical protein LOTGIDRAFT_165224 [Lottia gigantea]
MAFQMKQKILIASDGERDSEWAFDWYCNNLHRPGNNVIIVSCTEIGVKLATIAPEAIINGDETAIEVFIEEENKILAEKVSKYQKKLRSAMLVGKVLTSCHTSPSEVILNTAASEEVNMIIIGSKGCGLNRQGVGSVCNYLVSHSTIPVIVCRHPDAVNDGYVSKYVVDPKTMRLIPRRSFQSSTEPEGIPVADSSALNQASTATHRTMEEEHNALSVQNTDRRLSTGIPVINVSMTDTSNVNQIKKLSDDLNNEETQQNHASLESDESISTEMAADDNKMITRQTEPTQSNGDVEDEDLNNDITENTPSETLEDKDNLQSLGNGKSESKMQNEVPKLSTKDVSILLSTRLNKSSRIDSPQIQGGPLSNYGKVKTNSPSSSNSNEEDSTGSSVQKEIVERKT